MKTFSNVVVAGGMALNLLATNGCGSVDTAHVNIGSSVAPEILDNGATIANESEQSPCDKEALRLNGVYMVRTNTKGNVTDIITAGQLPKKLQIYKELVTTGGGCYYGYETVTDVSVSPEKTVFALCVEPLVENVPGLGIEMTTCRTLMFNDNEWQAVNPVVPLEKTAAGEKEIVSRHRQEIEGENIPSVTTDTLSDCHLIEESLRITQGDRSSPLAKGGEVEFTTPFYLTRYFDCPKKTYDFVYGFDYDRPQFVIKRDRVFISGVKRFTRIEHTWPKR